MTTVALTADPALPLPEPVQAALFAAVNRPGPLLVPVVEGVDGPVVLRWLYRRWLEAIEGWRPLVQIAGSIDPASLQDALQAARGGWLYRVGVTEPEARADGVDDPRLVLDLGGAPLPLASSLGLRMSALDDLHQVATDPGLDRFRRSLYSHARAGAAVLLFGPAGVGKGALVRLAWSRLGGSAPLVDGARASPLPSAWAVYPAPATLDEERRQQLHRRLQLEAPSANAVAAGPPMPRPDHPAFAALVGESPALCRLLQDALRVAPSPASVLILGEPGVGKELLARALHAASGRAGPFEAVDLSAIPRDLVESELFGHVRGAFTGAASDRPGAFRRAERGTLFIDELGNLDPSVQVKLLRVLQERVLKPVGAERAIPIDVRIIAATNADLDAMAERGAFRLDLLHRLNAITLRIPPLRERPEDILLLTRRFLAEARGDSTPPQISPAAARLLLRWPWPGNIRELWGLCMRAGAFSRPGEALGPEHIEPIAAEGGRGPTFVTALAPVVVPGLAVSLGVPTLRERGPESVQQAILSLARGRVIQADALALLSRLPWEGGIPDLQASLSALLAAIAGPIDRAAIQSALPHLIPALVPELNGQAATPEPAQPEGGELYAVLGAEAGEVGFERRYVESAVLVGRARALPEVGSGDRRGQAREEAVLALAGEVPAFLCFPQETSLSRAQVLVLRKEGRGGEELELHLLPDAAAQTWIRPFGGERERLLAGQPRRCGEAVDIEIMLDREGRRWLRLAFFLGAAARARGAAAPGPQPADPLVVTTREPLESEGEAPTRGDRVWALDPDERRLLNEIVLDWDHGDFSAHLRAGLLARRANPAHKRLASYLLSTRPTQYCARIYGGAENGPLREELCAPRHGRGGTKGGRAPRAALEGH